MDEKTSNWIASHVQSAEQDTPMPLLEKILSVPDYPVHYAMGQLLGPEARFMAQRHGEPVTLASMAPPDDILTRMAMGAAEAPLYPSTYALGYVGSKVAKGLKGLRGLAKGARAATKETGVVRAATKIGADEWERLAPEASRSLSPAKIPELPGRVPTQDPTLPPGVRRLALPEPKVRGVPPEGIEGPGFTIPPTSRLQAPQGGIDVPTQPVGATVPPNPIPTTAEDRALEAARRAPGPSRGLAPYDVAPGYPEGRIPMIAMRPVPGMKPGAQKAWEQLSLQMVRDNSTARAAQERMAVAELVDMADGSYQFTIPLGGSGGKPFRTRVGPPGGASSSALSGWTASELSSTEDAGAYNVTLWRSAQKGEIGPKTGFHLGEQPETAMAFGEPSAKGELSPLHRFELQVPKQNLLDLGTMTKDQATAEIIRAVSKASPATGRALASHTADWPYQLMNWAPVRNALTKAGVEWVRFPEEGPFPGRSITWFYLGPQQLKAAETVRASLVKMPVFTPAFRGYVATKVRLSTLRLAQKYMPSLAEGAMTDNLEMLDWMVQRDIMHPSFTPARTPDGKLISNRIEPAVRKMMDLPEFKALSKTEQLRGASIMERVPIFGAENPSGRPYHPYGGFTKAEDNVKLEDSSLRGLDTVKGCVGSCYECFANRLTGQALVCHGWPQKAKIVGVVPRFSKKNGMETLVRFGVNGDFSLDIPHSVREARGLMERSKAAGFFDYDPARHHVVITKLQGVDGWSKEAAAMFPNLMVSFDPMFSSDLRAAMGNVLWMRDNYPQVKIALRVRSFWSRNKELQQYQQMAYDFANNMNMRVLDTKMRFVRRYSPDLMELDPKKYVSLSPQWWALSSPADGVVNPKNLFVCNRAGVGCVGCLNCARVFDIKLRQLAEPTEEFVMNAEERARMEKFADAGGIWGTLAVPSTE
jgi:hypothetical protein